MRKKITAIAMALAFSMSLGGVAMAKTCKGTVAKNDGKQLVIDLKKKCSAKAGDEVKIKVKAKAAVEGC